MSYLVLARKFRPQKFNEVAGQDHITTALANAIVRNRVPHALLLCGPRGVGKTTCARILAKALNCSGRKIPDDINSVEPEKARELVEPCEECSSCKEISSSSSIAVREIDGASHNSVDNVRSLIETLLTVAPPGSQYKIYIIDEVHMLSTAAFNALLKSLEEPPPSTIFIFATTEPHKIPDTVISRCQRHDFRRINFLTIVDQLTSIIQKEGIEIENGVLEFVAKKAQGGMRDAQSMLDQLISASEGKVTLNNIEQVLGAVDPQFYFNLSEAVLSEDTSRSLELIDDVFSKSVDIRAFLADFIGHWRSLLLVKLTNENQKQSVSDQRLKNMLEVTDADIEAISSQVKPVSAFFIQRLFDVAEKTADKALQSNFPRFIIEAGIAKMSSLPSLKPLPEILSSLKNSSNITGAISEKKKHLIKDTDITLLRAESSADQGAKISSSESYANTSQREEIISNAEQQNSQPSEFNPSWEEFIKFVKGSSEPVLAAFLRRVSEKSFHQGRLQIEANEFDIDSLQDPEMLANLKNYLERYSGLNHWKIEFIKKEQNLEDEHLPGSVANAEINQRKERGKQIVKEAKEDPIVKAALSTFDGSKIEKVSILK